MNRTLWGIALLMTSVWSVAFGQGAYPAKPVRVVVPFPPSGSNDLVARLVMRELSEVMGQQFPIDNRAGAAGVIGAEIVAKAAPDGYTLMVHSTSHLSNAFISRKLPYDTFKDFEPISLLAAQPSILLVHPSLPVKSVKEFIALAKSRPNQITYGSSGEGSTLHVQMALLASMANIQMIHVPYKGGGPQTVSLLSGETQSSIVTMGSFLPYIKSGRVRMLGVTSARRSTIMPQIPTIAETVPGYDMAPWIGAFVPAGTPRAIVDRLNAEITKILKRPEFAKQMLDQGVEPWPSTPQEFSARLKNDYEQLQKIFKIIGTPAA